MLSMRHVPSAATGTSAKPARLSTSRSTRTVAPPTGPPGPVTVPARCAAPGPTGGSVVVVAPATRARFTPLKSGGSVVVVGTPVLGGSGSVTDVTLEQAAPTRTRTTRRATLRTRRRATVTTSG